MGSYVKPGRPLRLLHGVGLGLEGVQPPLVGLGLDVGLESVCVNKVFRAVDAVELSETSFIVVNVLSQQFVHFIYAEVRVNFIQVLCSSLEPPPLLEMCVAIVILLTLVWTAHIA